MQDGSIIDLRFEGGCSGWRDILGWLILGAWWSALLGGLLTGAKIPVLGAVAGGGLTIMILGFHALAWRFASVDRSRLRGLAERL